MDYNGESARNQVQFTNEDIQVEAITSEQKKARESKNAFSNDDRSTRFDEQVSNGINTLTQH